MSDGLRATERVVQTFWVGGMWVLALLVAPLLFRSHPAVAGAAVGQMLSWLAWVGLAAVLILLVTLVGQRGWSGLKSGRFGLLLLMTALNVLNYFAVFPVLAELKLHAHELARGVFGGGFDSWHTLSSLIYVVQCLVGVALVVRED